MSSASLTTYRFLFRLLSVPLWLYLMFRCMRGKEHYDRLSERWGQGYQTIRPKGQLIWCHAVSVGESVAALRLAAHLRAERPDIAILVTTNTVTAADKLQADDSIIQCFQPLDNQKWVARFLDYWHPDAAIILESDFWPEMMIATAERNIPLYAASAQLSERSAQNWGRYPDLAAQMFSAPRRWYAVDSSHAEQITRLIANENGRHIPADSKPDIIVAGSLKLPPRALSPDDDITRRLLQQAGERMILLLASSHEGEEELILTITSEARQAGELLVILAPRHPDRSSHLAGLSAPALMLSGPRWGLDDNGIIICDQMGVMDSLYDVAHLIILGGSFVPRGGHNPVEPARAVKPVITGPSDEKNTAEIAAFAETGLLIHCQDKEELTAVLMNFLSQYQNNTPLLEDTVNRAATGYLDQIYRRPEKIAQQICADLV